MHTEILTQFGLAKNEAKIYEVLLREGESSVGKIATKSEVHRRNVYDSLHRLIEKGLVFEVLKLDENRYQAVDPRKLLEILEEKKQLLERTLPDLESIYQDNPDINEVHISRGIEGWKNYMRDILRLGQDDYVIAGKGGWSNPKLKPFFEQFMTEAKRKNIKFHVLFDEVAKNLSSDFLNHSDYRFLPKKYMTKASVDIFADRVVLLTHGGYSPYFEVDSSFTIIINQQIADSFRIWFQFMWDMCKPGKRST